VRKNVAPKSKRRRIAKHYRRPKKNIFNRSRDFQERKHIMKHMQPKALVIALIAASLASPLMAQSNADILNELQALKSRIETLEAQLKQEQAKPKVEPAEFNRISVKTEAMEDSIEAQGLKLLKINGSIDPTFIANRAQRSSGFAFLNNFSSRDGSEVYTYDNSYFGMATLDLQKELDNGIKWRLTLAPHKSAGGNYNVGSIIHEATASIPLTDSNTRLWAGQLPDWSGYEYFLPQQNKFITHNMLFDYVAPTFYTGIGTDITRGKWIFKTALGNFNAARYGSFQRSPVVSYRVDYAKGEFNGFGFAGQHGKIANANGGISAVNMLELDGYFIRGPLTMQGQIAVGQQKKAAFNGGNSQWYGVSGLAAYKLTPRFEIAARADYLNNQKNGGGTFNLAFNSACYAERDAGGGLTTNINQSCGDGRNGFGPAMEFVTDSAGGSGQWEVADANKGANRYALTLGMNYLINQFTTLKVEFRHDQASGRVFNYVTDGSYRKSNQIIGVSTVVSF
jgi:Putative beta-barrel porin-2, OmpL-like. bbp2